MAKYDWPKLLAEFEGSNQKQAAFCRAKGLNPKYFNQKLSEKRRSILNGFSKVERSKAERQPQIASSSNALTIKVGHCEITLPSSMPTKSLVELIRGLA